MPVVPLMRRFEPGMAMQVGLEIEFAIANPGVSGTLTVSVARRLTGGSYESPRKALNSLVVDSVDNVVCCRGKATFPSGIGTDTYDGTGNIYVFIGGTRILPPMSSTNPDADAPKCGYAHDPLT